jgi:hypothetical protein
MPIDIEYYQMIADNENLSAKELRYELRDLISEISEEFKVKHPTKYSQPMGTIICGRCGSIQVGKLDLICDNCGLPVFINNF